MVITRSPCRISFFGGSSDYEDFYSKHGSFVISSTIDKYNYISARFRPDIIQDKYAISSQVFNNLDQIKNPLIRETIRAYNDSKKTLDVNFFSDIPSRTGLGGSSSCCCALISALSLLHQKEPSKKNIAKESIYIERVVLKESGGIQDQIAASYGGFNSIEINTDGDFKVKPLPISQDFKDFFLSSLSLIQVGAERKDSLVATSHQNKDKVSILNSAKEAYDFFVKEDIESISRLLKYSWDEKKNISALISNSQVSETEEKIFNLGAKAVKLLGAGGSGFLLAISDPKTNKKIKKYFKNRSLSFKFDTEGVTCIFKN